MRVTEASFGLRMGRRARTERKEERRKKSRKKLRKSLLGDCKGKAIKEYSLRDPNEEFRRENTIN